MGSKKASSYQFSSKVWLYPGQNAAWHFVRVPKKLSREIQTRYEGMTRGWGSFPVDATVGKTTWKTSIFPDKKSGTFLLPLKASVREKEGIRVNITIQISLTVRI